MRIKGSLTALLAAGAMIVGASTQASALSYGFSSFTVSNLTGTFTTGAGTQVGFGTTGFAFDASTAASLSSPAVSDAHTASASATFSCDRGIACPGVGPVDPLQAFVGNPAANLGQNKFTANGTANPNYARADHILNDVLINTAGGGVGGVANFGGDFQAVAETSISGAVTGTGSSGNNQTWNFGGVTGVAHTHLEFDLDLDLIASTTKTGEDSSAAFSLVFTMQDSANAGNTRSRTIGATTTSTIPGTNAINETNFDISGVNGAARVGSHFTIDFDTVAGSTYQFKIEASNRAQAQSIPQPMSLALLGAGLTGLGALSRLDRRSN